MAFMTPLFHPRTAREFSERDALLTKSLREDGAPFPIASEYPLVLSAAGARFSYCLGLEGKIAAHANLWPRELGTVPVGLVGNVATDAEHRGRGLMTAVMSGLGAEAEKLGLKALLL